MKGRGGSYLGWNACELLETELCRVDTLNETVAAEASEVLMRRLGLGLGLLWVRVTVG